MNGDILFAIKPNTQVNTKLILQLMKHQKHMTIKT